MKKIQIEVKDKKGIIANINKTDIKSNIDLPYLIKVINDGKTVKSQKTKYNLDNNGKFFNGYYKQSAGIYHIHIFSNGKTFYSGIKRVNDIRILKDYPKKQIVIVQVEDTQEIWVLKNDFALMTLFKYYFDNMYIYQDFFDFLNHIKVFNKPLF